MKDYQPSYVYQITHLPSGLKYIGSRWSSKLTDNNIYHDLGSVYFSSSTSDIFSTKIQKEYPHEYEYIILRRFNSAYEAQLCEEVLHEYFDVAKNPEFENKYKAKANKHKFPYLEKGQCVVYNELTRDFEVIFVEHMQEHHRYQTTGMKTVKNIYTNETKYVKIDEELGDGWVHIHHGTVNIIDENGVTRKITCEQYKNGTYSTKTSGKVIVRDIKEMGDWKLIESTEYDKEKHQTAMSNKITVYNTITQKTQSVNKNDPRLKTGEIEKLVPVKGDKKWVTQSEYKTGKYESVLSGMATLTKNDKTITVPTEDVTFYKEQGWRGVGSLSVFTEESYTKRRKSLQKVDESGMSGYDKRSRNYSKTVLKIGNDGLTIAEKRSMKIAETRKKKIGKLNLFDSEGTLIDTDYLLDLSRTYGIPRDCFDRCLKDKQGFFSKRPSVAKKKGLERFMGWYVERV